MFLFIILFSLPSRAQIFTAECVITGLLLIVSDIILCAENSAGDWTCTFSLWCLNPAVVFRDVAELSLSVILTSG